MRFAFFRGAKRSENNARVACSEMKYQEWHCIALSAAILKPG